MKFESKLKSPTDIRNVKNFKPNYVQMGIVNLSIEKDDKANKITSSHETSLAEAELDKYF